MGRGILKQDEFEGGVNLRGVLNLALGLNRNLRFLAGGLCLCFIDFFEGGGRVVLWGLLRNFKCMICVKSFALVVVLMGFENFNEILKGNEGLKKD
ncbi:hypothetical protein [Campylobacter cuniculorum]|uniref:hypothetical protein n=1 Tax=Campylobacter cuniculorum TaxID=374106 RepID=UPI0023EFC26F|nr:hypothetical protein [Campylobacter cuniculorum]